MSAPTPKFLAVIDLETSGLNVRPNSRAYGTTWGPDGDVTKPPHTPGTDPDCILEVGLVVLDASTLTEMFKKSWLVLPPGVSSKVDFEVWVSTLRECSKFVYDMHDNAGEGPDDKSLLYALRDRLGSTMSQAYSHAFIEESVIDALKDTCGAYVVELMDPNAGVPKERHPGNSDIILTGNSIANLDLPMLRNWMPKLHNMLSYRIMDVSVLRTFYVDLARTIGADHPTALAIKSGGGGHRALSDALYCSQFLRELVVYARGTAAVREKFA